MQVSTQWLNVQVTGPVKNLPSYKRAVQNFGSVLFQSTLLVLPFSGEKLTKFSESFPQIAFLSSALNVCKDESLFKSISYVDFPS